MTAHIHEADTAKALLQVGSDESHEAVCSRMMAGWRQGTPLSEIMGNLRNLGDVEEKTMDLVYTVLEEAYNTGTEYSVVKTCSMSLPQNNRTQTLIGFCQYKQNDFKAGLETWNKIDKKTEGTVASLNILCKAGLGWSVSPNEILSLKKHRSSFEYTCRELLLRKPYQNLVISVVKQSNMPELLLIFLTKLSRYAAAESLLKSHPLTSIQNPGKELLTAVGLLAVHIHDGVEIPQHFISAATGDTHNVLSAVLLCRCRYSEIPLQHVANIAKQFNLKPCHSKIPKKILLKGIYHTLGWMMGNEKPWKDHSLTPLHGLENRQIVIMEIGKKAGKEGVRAVRDAGLTDGMGEEWVDVVFAVSCGDKDLLEEVVSLSVETSLLHQASLCVLSLQGNTAAVNQLKALPIAAHCHPTITSVSELFTTPYPTFLSLVTSSECSSRVFNQALSNPALSKEEVITVLKWLSETAPVQPEFLQTVLKDRGIPPSKYFDRLIHNHDVANRR